MPTKRARITERDPLTPTDKVLAQYEQVNKSASQLPESAGTETQSPKKLTSTQVDKTTSQQPNFSTSEEVNNLKSTSQQANNLTSEEANQVELTSQQANNLTSEEVVIEPSIGTESNKSASKQSNKSASQQAKIADSNQPTSQQFDLLTSEQANMTDSNQPASQQSKNTRSQIVDMSTSQQAQNPVLRKATFQVDGAILDALDRYHLQLQIELGKRNTPYKEILVEEAIAQWLERATKSPDRVVKSLLKRQEQR
jgi:hypothetical protein